MVARWKAIKVVLWVMFSQHMAKWFHEQLQLDVGVSHNIIKYKCRVKRILDKMWELQINIFIFEENVQNKHYKFAEEINKLHGMLMMPKVFEHQHLKTITFSLCKTIITLLHVVILAIAMYIGQSYPMAKDTMFILYFYLFYFASFPIHSHGFQ